MTQKNGSNKKTVMWVLVFFCLIFCFIPDVFCWIEKGNQEEKEEKDTKNQLLVLPIVYYTPETKLAGGVGGIYYLRSLEDKHKHHESTLLMDVIYTQKKQSIVEITPDLYLKKGEFHQVGYLGFKNYAENFYGIGSDTTESMEENFSYRSLKLIFSPRKRISPHFFIGIQYDFEYFKITELEPGGILETGDIVGNEGGIQSGLGILLVRDNRDNIFFPWKGTLLQAQASFFSQALGSDYRFQRYTFDFRQYVTVFSKHVLAFQQNISVSSGSIPFQWLPMLGGSRVMRGYIEGRFRDKNAIYLQMEYRAPLFWRLSAVGFVGCGEVATKLSDFKLFDFKLTGGFGIRYRLNRLSGTNVRLDFGFAEGNFGVYAMINEAF